MPQVVAANLDLITHTITVEGGRPQDCEPVIKEFNLRAASWRTTQLRIWVPLICGLTLFALMRTGVMPMLMVGSFSWLWLATSLVSLGIILWAAWPTLRSAKTSLKMLGPPLLVLAALVVLPSLLTAVTALTWLHGLWLGLVCAAGLWVMLAAIFAKEVGMHTSLSLAILSAWSFSTLLIFCPQLTAAVGVPMFIHSALMLLGVIGFGHYCREQAISWVRQDAFKRTMDFPSHVTKSAESAAVQIGIDDVVAGDIIKVDSGTQSAVDGIVVSGESSMDAHVLTGETTPRLTGVNQPVKAGEKNIGVQALWVRVDESSNGKAAAGDNAAIGVYLRRCEAVMASRSVLRTRLDKVARWIVPTLVLTALGSAAMWAVFGPAPTLAYTLLVFISVLLSACPCVWYLATPIAGRIASSHAAHHDAHCIDSSALERLRHVKAWVFDKTGVLTQGFGEQGQRNIVREAAWTVVNGLGKAVGSDHVWLMSGDSDVNVTAIATRVGVLQTHQHAACSLDEVGTSKVAHVEGLLHHGPIAFVGDGPNDVAAAQLVKKKGGVVFAMHTACPALMAVADIVLTRNRLQGITQARRIAEELGTNVRRSLWLAGVYNGIMVPLAAGGAYVLWGSLLSPVVAGVAMALSSLFVVANALHLRPSLKHRVPVHEDSTLCTMHGPSKNISSNAVTPDLKNVAASPVSVTAPKLPALPRLMSTV